MGVFYTGASGVGNGPHLDARVWNPKTKKYLDLRNAENRAYLNLLRSGDKPVMGTFPLTSDYGPRNTGIPGASTFHQGVDFGTPEGTPITVQGGAWKEYAFDEGGGHMGIFGFKGKGGEDLEFVLMHGQERNKDNRPPLPPVAGSGTLATVSREPISETLDVPAPAAAEAPAAPPPPPDWREAAGSPTRVTNPSNPAYWQREDIRQWAAANSELAKTELARRGGDASWLAVPAAAAVAVKPEDRGALNGVQVGGAPPPPPAPKPSEQAAPPAPAAAGASRFSRPLLLELHGDHAEGQSGLIGAYDMPDNPAYQALAKAYGTYGPNYSRQWRDGDLGGPKRGLGIVEMAPLTPALQAQLSDPKQRLAAFQKESKRLYGTLTSVPEIRDGKQQVHFFVGHGDVPDGPGAETGAAGERTLNAGVFAELEAQAKREGRRNFVFHRPERTKSGEDPRSNWSRAQALWQQGGGK